MTMLEKVARAICLANTQGDEMWQAFVPEARAALEAMKTPTDGMVEYGGPEMGHLSASLLDVGNDWIGKPKFVWEAMINAALEGK